MKITAAGDRAILVELGDVTAEQLHAAAREMRAQPGVLAVIPGHSSLYVIRGRSARVGVKPSRDPVTHRVPVAFDGVDLQEFLRRTGLALEQFLARAAGLRLVARYLGFRGGFAYLDGWPEEWSMPRRETSRPVPRGSFAIAGNVAGFYPIDSPGGWNLLGTTDLNLEYQIAAGDGIEIEPVAELSGRRQASPAAGPDPAAVLHAKRIEAPLSAIVSAADDSRLEVGRPAGGPFDEELARAANRAAGNDEEAPLLECAMVGPHVVAEGVIAWFGPDGGRIFRGEARIGRIAGGLRGYLAVGKNEGPVSRIDRGDRLTIRAMAGPHATPITSVTCEVTPQLDRVGIRLRPLEPLPVTAPADMKSIGMQCGTVQLHPDGSLVVMGPDHPVTGGYLQPMTVLSSERWKLAQLAPGERVRLVTHWP